MTSCPECLSDDVEDMNDDYDPETGSSCIFYQCQECGCEFYVESITTWSTTVEKHGEVYEENKVIENASNLQTT
jgi:hypothetical protein